MTPPATTAAARASRQPEERVSPERVAPERPPPRAPRRVSGPASGRARSTGALPTRAIVGAAAPAGGLVRGTGLAPARTAPVRKPAARPRVRSPWRPRLKLRPHRRLGIAAPRTLKLDPGSVLAATAAAARGLPDHQLLDRLVRGRWWIPLLGVVLTGVVAVQVEVLKYGASFGKNINLASSLQSANQLLRLDISRLSDPERIEQLAAGYGMVMAGPTGVDFVDAHRSGSMHLAIRSIRVPDPGSFLTALAAKDPTGSSTSVAGGVAPMSGTATPSAGATSGANTPSATTGVGGTTLVSNASAAAGTSSTAAATGSTAAATGSTAVGAASSAPSVGATSAAGTPPTTPSVGATAPTTAPQTSASTGPSVSGTTAPPATVATSAGTPVDTGTQSGSVTATGAATDNGAAALPAG
jgi:hypothetical protein